MGKIAGMRPSRLRRLGPRPRCGAATLDYVLILAFVLPMLVFITRVAPRILRSTYDVVCMLVSWPFL